MGNATALIFPMRELRKAINLESAVDILFVQGAARDKDGLISYLTSRFRIDNTSHVTANVCSKDEGPSGEIGPGVYRINNGFDDAGVYTFEWSGLNNGNVLIIANEGVKYKKQFNEVCQVLEYFFGRNLYFGGRPETYALFRDFHTRDDFSFAGNIVVPVGKHGERYLPFPLDFFNLAVENTAQR